MHLSQEQLKTIIDFLIKNINPSIIYIFGSVVKESFNQFSDIDIAFLSDQQFSEYNTFMLAQELASLTGREVDLIDLKKASTVFKIQVIVYGKIIYCANETTKAFFEMRSFHEYVILNEERKFILEDIKKRSQIYE